MGDRRHVLAGVVLRNLPDDDAGEHPHHHASHDRPRYGRDLNEYGRARDDDDRGHHESAEQRALDLALVVRPDGECAENRRHDTEPGQQNRKHGQVCLHGRERAAVDAPEGFGGRGGQRPRERNGRNDAADIRLEEVGAHPSDVPDVVTDSVRNGGRVARVILRDSRLDLAREVAGHVGGLREDAAADSSEERNRRRAEREPEEGADRSRTVTAHPAIEVVQNRDTQRAEGDDGEAHDGAARERHLQRGREAGLCRRGGSDRSPGGRAHADPARQAGQRGADQKADAHQQGITWQKHHEDDEHDADEHREHAVLRLQERHRPGSDQGGDLLHALGTSVATVDALGQHERKDGGRNWRAEPED